MKTQHLFILVAVLAALLATGALLRRPSTDARSAADQAGMLRLIDSRYGEEHIRRITISNAVISDQPSPDASASDSAPGDSERREVVLVKSDAGAWTVASARNVPANGEKIAELFAALHNLTGDLHAERAESHKSLGVDADGALRVGMGLTGDADDLILHVGGRPGGEYSESYVRRNDEPNVYRVPVDLRRAAGLNYQGAELEAKTWLDVNLFRDLSEDVASVTFDYSGHSLIVRREKGGEDGDWTLLEGGKGRDFKPEALMEWLRGLPSFAASGIADPPLPEAAPRSGERRAWTVAFAGDSEKKTRSLQLATVDGIHYIESSERPGFVYTADDSGVDRVFPPLASLLDFRILPDSGAIERVESDDWILAREVEGGRRWLITPIADAGEPREIETTVAENYLKRLSGLEGIGFAPAPDAGESPPVEKRLAVRVHGQDVAVSFGPEENGMRPVYAKDLAPLAVKADDVRAIFRFPDEHDAAEAN